MNISCIICAYNEGSRMKEVLAAVTSHPSISEVIVVDDGSGDDTAEVARSYPNVRLISHAKNSGKSTAVATGIAAAQYDTLALLDADLIGITAGDVSALIEPVAAGMADITISLRKNSLPIHRLIGLDFSSGERIIPKKLLAPHLDKVVGLPGFGIETFMNELVIEQKLRVGIVYWPHVYGLMKWRKMGLMKGVYEDLRMTANILRVMPLHKLIRQNYRLLRQIVNPGKRFFPLFKGKLLLHPPIQREQ